MFVEIILRRPASKSNHILHQSTDMIFVEIYVLNTNRNQTIIQFYLLSTM